MACVTFSPAVLSGRAQVPPSKSEAHRALLLAALGSQPCVIRGIFPLCDDTRAMLNGIAALGAQAVQEGADMKIIPIPRDLPVLPMATCNVHACAAALRMLIPVFWARGQAVRFLMDPALFNRPLEAYEPLGRKIGAVMKRVPDAGDGRCALEISGFLPAGSYEIDGSLSSQFASGMLIALGRAGHSILQVTGPIVSRPYLDMTLSMIRRFGIGCTENADGCFEIHPAAQDSPASYTVSGDWSQGAVFLCMNAMGSHIEITNLPADPHPLQGDTRITEILAAMNGADDLRAAEIDCSDIPDLAPMLALTCSQARGISVLRGVSRLRAKESDRLKATRELLDQLGAKAEICDGGDTLRVSGPARLRGGFKADAHNDHRMVMFLAAAALIADGPITVRGAECLNKSWPEFLNTYRVLGGKAE